jgi:hypothetical protein
VKICGDDVIFSSGKVVYANRGILGIDSRLETFYGYDGGFPAWPAWEGASGGLTRVERHELADHMIALWTQFKSAEAPMPDEDTP